MCGICGKVFRERGRLATREDILPMRDAMRARGPDAGGLHLDAHVGLGHRRLSVIDLETSAQPMSNDDESIWITYNGEIYNFAALREQLVSKGYRFRTSGDTEVIIRLYEEFGEDCVDHLRGMFAFAIWDARKQSMFLARDRIGVKPLYYAWTSEAFLFGSELKALVADAAFRQERNIDPEAVHSYLSFLSVPDPLCIYKNVWKLPAAHTLTLQDGQVTRRRYWDVRFDATAVTASRDWRAELLQCLQDAVRIRLVADVPLGAFLSGGMDSSTVVAVMASQMSRPVRTFSIGFSEATYDETSDARLVAQHLGTDHTELILDPEEVHPVIPRLLRYFDEPFADSSAIPTHFVSELARQSVTVALSGDGGDELFGGYPWRQQRPAYQQFVSRLPIPVRSALASVTRRLPAGLKGVNFLSRADMPYARYIVDAAAVFDDADRLGLYDPEFGSQVARLDPYVHHLANLDQDDGRPWSSRIMEYDLKTYLPNDILTKVDRMSMLNSLEAREPLLDQQLVELAAVIPPELKIRHGVGKQILKDAIGPHLPPAILSKRKQGFSIPLDAWLRTRLRNDVLDTLKSGNQHHIFNRDTVAGLVDAFYRGDTARNHQVWSLYAFELWYQHVHVGASGPGFC